MPEDDDDVNESDASAAASPSTPSPRQLRLQKRRASSPLSTESKRDSDDDYEFEPVQTSSPTDPYPTLERKQEIVNYWKNQTATPRSFDSMQNRFPKLTNSRMLKRIEQAVLNSKFDDFMHMYGFVFYISFCGQL